MTKSYKVNTSRITYKSVGGKMKTARYGDIIDDKGRLVRFSWLVDRGLVVEVDTNEEKQDD